MKSRNAAAAVRDMIARQEAVRQYARAHDRFSEEEQLRKLEGDVIEAEGAHTYAVRALRACVAEMNEPLR